MLVIGRSYGVVPIQEGGLTGTGITKLTEETTEKPDGVGDARVETETLGAGMKSESFIW